MQLTDLVVFWTILLLKPSLLRRIGNNLKEYKCKFIISNSKNIFIWGKTIKTISDK